MNKSNVEDIYPLSPLQQGLLFHTLYDPKSGLYFDQTVYSLRGRLNVSALKRAWQQTVDRHAILRTLFLWEQRNDPLQVVRRQVKLPWVEEDWRSLPQARQEERLEGFLKADQGQPFHLNQAPLMRLALIKVADDAHYIVWSRHHLLLDKWSTSLLLKEVWAFYNAYCQGQELHLGRSRPYRDHIAWLRAQDLSQAELFWRQTLKGFTTPTAVEVKQTPRTLPDREIIFDSQKIRLPVTVTTALQSLAMQHRLTLNTLVQGAWALLLGRYSGAADVVFGATVSGRPPDLVGVESMVGLFINTLPVRVRVTDGETLLLWLKRLQERMVELRQYEYSPLVQVQRWSEVPRGLPLFESILVFENIPMDVPLQELDGGLEVGSIRYTGGRTNYPLTVVALPRSELLLQITYDCSRFDTGAINRMLGHFQTLLQGIVANPEQRLSHLRLLSEEEKHQLLVAWNHTKRDYPKDQCIHQLFEEQVERSPDAVAVVFDEKQLTYRELNLRANQLAHHLRKLGVGPEVPVGICVERSLEMVVGLLGILKAGAAYVPLDPDYPKERLAFMLQDSRAPVLLTEQRLLESFPEHETRVVCLDRDWEIIAWEKEENLVNAATADNLAYVIYTSGSTGEPKGVAVPHRAVNRLVVNADYVKIEPFDHVAQASNCSFDAATFEIWGSLLQGARLVGITRDVTLSPQEFAAQIREQEISILFLTTALFNQMAREVPWAFRSVRHLLFGGEAVDPRWVREVVGHNHPQRLLHVFGPTESTTFASWHSVEEVPEGATTVPIGRPIANTYLYVLDGGLNPAPIGVAGEMYIGGDGLARGYFNSPNLTAEKFIPDPFGRESGARLYKTGDLARYLPDGNIEFLGRIDYQVKIRGFRIELGEIEAVLGQHPAVRETVVVAREDRPGDKHLVAYVVPSQESAPTTVNELRSFLKTKLPDYMIPSTLVMLDALPLTPNGKVDRRALPAPDQSRPELEHPFVAPRTPIERALVSIWTEVLRLHQVGIHDNFFDLGGHSLLATQVISRVRNTFQVELPLRSLFQAPTIAGLAEHVQAALQAEQGFQVPSLQPVSRDRDLPLSFAQQRLWFLDQLEPGSPVYNIPAAFRLAGALNLAALEQSLNEVVRRHEILRTSFSSVEGQPVQAIAPTLRLTLLLVDLSSIPEAKGQLEALRLATEQAQRPFDLSQAPLLRASVLRIAEHEHILLLTIHHIVSDGWSMGVLFQELSALYDAFCTGKPSPLPELPIQYADFAVWQRQWPQGEDSQLSYWKKQLADAPAALELPTDRPRPPFQTYRGARQSVVLSPALTNRLKTLSHRESVTLFVILLAAFQTLLYRYTQRGDIIVGSPIAGRNRTEIEGLIGFFVNTLVLRTDLSGDPSFRELLGRVRKVALDAYAHQDLPFEKLVKELQPERNLSHSPLFQVMFVLQNAPMTALRLAGLTVSPLKVDSETAKFDLTLSMVEEADSLKGVIEYSTDLFDEATIGRMMGHFQTMLESLVENPGHRLSDLPILTEAEKQQLLVEWNDTKKNYPRDKCIHELFEAQVERTPKAVAVVFEEEQLTYLELNQRANQLAHYLSTLGVGPDALVGICVERSLEMVVGILGVLKAGGAYVPLDPGYPKERVALMIEDSQAQVLLTQQRLLEGLPAFRHSPSAIGNSQSAIRNPTVICLDTGWEAIAAQSQENPVSPVKADNLAYMIYTSGSTGKPKGVQVLHRAVVNFLNSMRKRPGLTEKDILVAVTTLSFDIAGLELFLPLSVGARVVLASSQVAADGSRLAAVLATSGATLMQATPSTWRLLMEAGWQTPDHFKVLCGGESLPRDLADHLLDRAYSVWNMYGPTETTIWSATQRVASGGSMIPVGRPIDNTQIYILDPYLNPVPVGVPGELYIGGVGLARGYRNRLELVAEKFIPDPFSGHPGARLYRTGDRARYLSNGSIEFLGRTDYQVKIRGFRIELGEIETLLGQHSAVRETVVVVREDDPEDRRLVAYVVLNQESVPTASELRSFLKAKLPDYMVPSAFVFRNSLPVTPNGKVDRHALPAPDETRPGLKETFVTPRTPTEKLLAKIWAEVLRLEQIGIHDNFFELGGHSLNAMRLTSRISAAMDIDISVKLLFAHPTISSLAEAIGNLEASNRRPRGAQLEPIGHAVADKLPPFSTPQDSTFMRIERRPLLSLFAAGKIASVDAAAIGYLPDRLPEQTGLTRDEIIDDWYEQLPTPTAILETFLGRIAIIILPIFASELYRRQYGLVSVLIESLEMAGKLGARTVSLTGIIPSATDYGRAVQRKSSGRNGLPKITTGHATTAATVVLAIKRILQEGGRELTQERLGFLGLGSIGYASLRLMLRCLPHPAEIILCDVYSNPALERVRQELVRDLGFRGPIRIVESHQGIPPAFYDATLIIGATNVPDVLDVTRLNSGTMIVDDSAPHCLAPGDAVRRFQKQSDILFTGGGTLRLPHPISRLSYLPRSAEKAPNSAYMKVSSRHSPFQITGCVLSSLLSARFEDLKPTVGPVDDSASLQHFERLSQLRFQAADPYCEDFILPEESILNFRQRFGYLSVKHRRT